MKYLFAAEISRELAQEVEETIEAVRASSSPEDHREAGADLVLRLTEACLEAYFLRPVRALEVGFVSERATTFGVNAANRAIALFVRKITGSLSGEQVLHLADLLDDMLVTRPA